MKVTEKMITDAANALGKYGVYVGGSAMKYALEAALSTDAEPVAWQPRYKQEVIDHHKSIGSDLWEYAMTVYPTKEQAQGYGYGGHECRALYAEPVKTAPSVAVKALRWKGPDSYGEYHSLDGLWGYIIRCEDDGHWLTEVGDYFRSPEAAMAAAQADYDARIRSALSAQVQDVAIPDGWQLVPKEPTQEMLEAADDKRPLPETFLIDAYRAMLAAAPAAKLDPS